MSVKKLGSFCPKVGCAFFSILVIVSISILLFDWVQLLWSFSQSYPISPKASRGEFLNLAHESDCSDCKYVFTFFFHRDLMIKDALMWNMKYSHLIKVLVLHTWKVSMLPLPCAAFYFPPFVMRKLTKEWTYNVLLGFETCRQLLWRLFIWVLLLSLVIYMDKRLILAVYTFIFSVHHFDLFPSNFLKAIFNSLGVIVSSFISTLRCICFGILHFLMCQLTHWTALYFQPRSSCRIHYSHVVVMNLRNSIISFPKQCAIRVKLWGYQS